MSYWLRTEGSITPYNQIGETALRRFKNSQRIDEIGSWEASTGREAAGTDLLEFSVNSRVAARCYAQLAPGTAAVEDGGGIIDSIVKDGEERTITASGLGFGVELTERVIPRLALWTNSGADPLPASLVLGTILAYAPAGWSAFGTPSRDIYYDARRMTVFDALLKVAELTGDHFRLGPGREVHWLSAGTTPEASGLWASGDGDPIAIEENPAVCAVAAIKLTREGKALATRFYAYGGGDEVFGVTLEAAQRFGAPGYLPGDYFDETGTYMLHIDGDPEACYLANVEAEASFGRIERVLEINDIVPLTRDAAGVAAASNTLHDVTQDVLGETAYPQLFYDVTLAGVQMQLWVGQTIHVSYHDYERTEEGTTERWLDIEKELLILAVEVQHDEADLRDVRLDVVDAGAVGAWPLTDADIVAALLRRLKERSSVKQAPIRDDTFFMAADVIKVVNDERVAVGDYIPLIPLNAAAVARQAGSGYLEVFAGEKLFQVQTADGVSAAGDEQYRYQVVKT